MKNTNKKVIGWREYIDLPDWGIKRLKAKIDTGARTSALHVEDIKELPNNKISFYIVLGKNKERKKIVVSPEKKGRVKSSIGIRTHRWYVETKIRIGDIERTIKVNLVGREGMNFRMLVGRTAILDDFLVDSAHGYLFTKKKVSSNKKKTLTKKTK